jgi:hypothetical protein
LAALLALGLVPGAAAQTPPAGYRPGLGDLMVETIQSRHIKLGLAGRAGNWPLAAFELGQLEESFDRVARTWPSWRSFSIADMVEVVKAPQASLQQAIKARDEAGFTAAYRQLTEACNGCHTGVNRGMIVIVAPDAPAYPDQDFAPKPQ